MTGDERASETRQFVVSAEQAGVRLDWFLAQQLPAFSRVL
jgi:hypothetical protein